MPQRKYIPTLITTQDAPGYPVARLVYFMAAVCVSFVFLSVPSSSIGADLTFAPQITSSEGYLEIGMESQTTENTQNGTGSKSSSTALHEGIILAADGYVYHPRFLIFLTKLSGALNQSSDTGSFRTTLGSARASESHELRAIFLPEHPYNLELFTRHQQAASTGTFLRVPKGTLDEQGAIFSYKNRPVIFHSSYVTTRLESNQLITNSDTYRVNGSYAGSVMTDSAAYSHTDSTSSSAVHTTREDYTFGNNIHIARLALDSRVNNSSTDQKIPLNADFHTDTLSWTEQLTATLPWNFDSIASFGYFDANNITAAYESDPEIREFNRSTSASFSLTQRLYQSLVTNYTWNNIAVESTTGEIKTESESISSTYTKTIPKGKFIAGVHLSSLDSERTGTPSIINEVYNAAILGSFTLTRSDIVESTVVIQVKDPSTGSLITLPQSSYLVNSLGGRLEITIVSVSPLTAEADPFYVYAFYASYSISDQSETIRDSWGYSLKLDLLDNHLSLYYNYATSELEVVSGMPAGGSGSDTTDTAGIIVKGGHYTGLLERERYRSWQNPYESLKATGEYRAPLVKNGNIATILMYQKIDYFPTASQEGSTETRHETYSANFIVDKRIPSENLSFFITASITRNRSFIVVDTYSVNTYLSWKVGLLTVNGGVQTSRSESMLSTGKAVVASQYYYLTLNRKLF
jgi:hypothetical protein